MFKRVRDGLPQPLSRTGVVFTERLESYTAEGRRDFNCNHKVHRRSTFQAESEFFAVYGLKGYVAYVTAVGPYQKVGSFFWWWPIRELQVSQKHYSNIILDY
jgi:hypothetical protein